MSRPGKRLIIVILAGVLVLVGLTVYGGLGEVLAALSGFRWVYIIPVLLLVCLSYLLRFFRWDYYLRTLGIRVTKSESALVFFSGFSLTITPYKVGEVMKSYLLKQLNGTDISRTLPIVFAERITDIIGLVVLASAGATVYRYGIGILIGIFSLIVLIVLVLQSRRLSLRLIALGERLPFLSRFAFHLHQLYESAFELLRLDKLIIASLLSLGWFFECAAAYVVLREFGVDMSLLQVTSIYALASVAGGVLMTPSGLGVMETGMTGLLIMSGISKATAASATILIRVATLWFSVIIGVVALSLYSRKYLGPGAAKMVGGGQPDDDDSATLDSRKRIS